MKLITKRTQILEIVNIYEAEVKKYEKIDINTDALLNSKEILKKVKTLDLQTVSVEKVNKICGWEIIGKLDCIACGLEYWEVFLFEPMKSWAHDEPITLCRNCLNIAITPKDK